MNLLVINLIYVIIVTSFFSLQKGSKKNNHQKSDKTCLILIFFPLFILHGFKEPSSLKDLQDYSTVFRESGSYSFGELIKNDFDVGYSEEPGYILLNKVVSLISSDVTVFFIIIAAIVLYCYAKSIYRYSALVPLSCLLFVIGPFNQSLFIVRQHLAIALLLLTFPFIINRKFWKFLIVFCAAFFIHYTAFVFLPVYFLYWIRNRKKMIMTLVILLVVIKLGMTFFLNYAIVFNGSWKHYVELEEVANYKMALFLFGIAFVRYLSMKGVFFQEGCNKLFNLIIVIGFIFYFAGIGFGPTGRLFMVYGEYLCLIIPQTLYYIKNPLYKYAVAFVFIGAMFLAYLGQFGEVERFQLLF